MVNLTIDGKLISVPEGTKIIDAAALSGIKIPSLCYLKGINETGACRVCVVEAEGEDRLITACGTVCEEGMIIRTNSPRVREARRVNVELILSKHDYRCASCVRGGNCGLQEVAADLGIFEPSYEQEYKHERWPADFPLIRDSEKCIMCMRCVQVCDKIQGLGVWDAAGSGARARIAVSGKKSITESDCSLCGQCITHCPVGALRERDDTRRVFDALNDPEKIVLLQIAPSVRAAWGEPLGISREFATVGRLVAALRRMGFKYIFDTSFSADLTIMEESRELLERYTGKGKNNTLPMFTSCCPGWVRFVKSQYPGRVDALSSAKSPQQMFGAVAKTYFAEWLKVSPDRIFSVSVMPCVAKKFECAMPEMNNATGVSPDVDVVLTTRETDRMIKASGIVAAMLEEEGFDSPLGEGSGAGVIFGATGGVMEAALRTAHYTLTGKNPPPDLYEDVRGLKSWKEATFNLGGNPLRVAVVSGLGNARDLLEALDRGEVSYDFIEVMACPGGCSGGGGQPIYAGSTESRADVLYKIDKDSAVRYSHENRLIKDCYENFLDKIGPHETHLLLHTEHNGSKN